MMTDDRSDLARAILTIEYLINMRLPHSTTSSKEPVIAGAALPKV
jgi:hypothetical protein